VEIVALRKPVSISVKVGFFFRPNWSAGIIKHEKALFDEIENSCRSGR
jgi:hypothetical protein